MFIKNISIIGATLIAGLFMLNACDNDSPSEPENNDLNTSSSISVENDSSSSEENNSESSISEENISESSSSEKNNSESSSSRQEDTTSTNKRPSTPSEESRLPQVPDQDGPHYKSYAFLSNTEKDGFSIITYDRHFCRATTYDSDVIPSIYHWDFELDEYDVLILKKVDNGLYIYGYSTLDMEHIYQHIEELKDTAALAKVHFYTGTSEDIYGEWTYQPKDTTTLQENYTIILTQDSVHFLTYINPEINYTTPNDLYLDFGDVFGKEIYREISDGFFIAYNTLGDIPSRGIKLTQSDSSIFIDMNGQELEYLVKKKYTKRTQSFQYIIKSGEDRCSYTTYTQELMESEFCSSTYKDYIKVREYNTQNEIYQLIDPGYKDSYIDCFKKLIEGNPAWGKSDSTSSKK